MITSQQIELFLSLAKHLNFTKTAKEYYTTQPTVSRQISLLEEAWGFPLFVRSKKEVRLTPEGAVMLTKCRAAMDAVSEGLQEVLSIRQDADLSIRIGCLEGMDLDVFVAPTAAYFSRRYPNVNIAIERRSFGELREKLEHEKLDLIFTLDFELKYMKHILYDRYYPVQAGFLLPGHHRLAAREQLRPEDLSGENFILPDGAESPGRTDELLTILKKMGIRCGKILYVPNQESMLLNVRTGKGIALLDNSLREVYDGDRYRFLEIPRELAPLYVVCVWKKENLNPAVALYTNTLSKNEFIDVFVN